MKARSQIIIMLLFLLANLIFLVSCDSNDLNKFQVTKILSGRTIEINGKYKVDILNAKDNGANYKYLYYNLLRKYVLLYDAYFNEIVEINGHRDSMNVIRIDSLISINKFLDVFKKQNDYLKTNANSLDTIFNHIKNAVFLIKYYRIDKKQGCFGTGFIIDQRGVGITNYHVLSIKDFKNIRNFRIQYQDEKIDSMVSQLFYYDEDKDILVFGLNSRKDERIELSNKIESVSSEVFTIGYSNGPPQKLNGGIILGYSEDSLFIKLPVIFNKGNSGAPLINKEFRAIGITTARENIELNTSLKGIKTSLFCTAINLQSSKIRKKILESTKTFRQQ